MEWLKDVDEKRERMMNLLMRELCSQMVRYLERKFNMPIDESGYELKEKGDDFYDENLISFKFVWKNSLKVEYYYYFNYGPPLSRHILCIHCNDQFLYEEMPNVRIYDITQECSEKIQTITNYFVSDDDFIKVSHHKYKLLYNTSYYHDLHSLTTFLLICKLRPIFPKDIYLLIAKKIIFFSRKKLKILIEEKRK